MSEKKLPFSAGDRLIGKNHGIEMSVKIMAICEDTGKMMLSFQETGTWKKISDVLDKINRGLFTVEKKEKLT